jgi:hypothetical protein
LHRNGSAAKRKLAVVAATDPVVTRSFPQKRDPSGRFVRGFSGNPGGRPRLPLDVQALARTHTVAALNTLIDCMTSLEAPWPSRITAAIALLDRGWGRPGPAIDSDGERITSLVLHVVASAGQRIN